MSLHNGPPQVDNGYLLKVVALSGRVVLHRSFSYYIVTTFCQIGKVAFKFWIAVSYFCLFILASVVCFSPRYF